MWESTRGELLVSRGSGDLPRDLFLPTARLRPLPSSKFQQTFGRPSELPSCPLSTFLLRPSLLPPIPNVSDRR